MQTKKKPGIAPGFLRVDHDYVYFVANGTVAAEGTPDDLRQSNLPFVHQFVHGEKDGPVPFHYAAADYKTELLGFEKRAFENTRREE